MALVFKCLTDNILLDDFKSVLQRLVDLKPDQTTPVLLNTMDTNPSEKASSADHREEAFGESSSQGTRDQPLDHSETAPDHNQLLDDYENGYKTQGMSVNVVGKLGIKIHKLPRLPS